MAEFQVTIERMCYGGAGFARLEGKACFVPFTAPGDVARVRVAKEKRAFVEGELVELVSPSAVRVPPVCPLFGRCGGCDWQHLPYPEQLSQKTAIFAETLRRIGKVDPEVVQPTAPAPDPYGYRSRVQLKVSVNGCRVALGFFGKGSHTVVDAPEGCPIAHPLLNRMSAEFRALVASTPQLSATRQIDLAMGDDGASIAVLHLERPDPALLARLAQAQQQLPSVSGLFVRSGSRSNLERVFGIEALSYGVPASRTPDGRELRLSFGRGGFSQVNYPQNQRLIGAVLELAQLTGRERVLDLYCGNGNISVPLAPLAREVLGIEGYAPSIADADANAAANGVANATFQTSDAGAAVRRLTRRGESFDVVVLDPPRSGAVAAEEIAGLAPGRIVYVSCDPPTLARDLALLGAQGYRVARSQPIDMFPQTYHLESVTLLERL